MATRQDFINYMTANYHWSTLGINDFLALGSVTVASQTYNPSALATANSWQTLIDAKTAHLAAINAGTAKITDGSGTADAMQHWVDLWTRLGRFRTS